MQRNISLDVLKLVMAFMVIALHAGFLSQVSALGSYLTVQGIFRIVVPVFLLISGFFFFSVVTNPNASPANWFKRIAILYCIWMGVYSIYWFDMPDGSLQSWMSILKTLLFGYYHLWYLSGMLMGAGLLYCLRNASSVCLCLCTLVTYSLGVWIQYAANYHWVDSPILNSLFHFDPIHRGPLLLSFPFLTIGYLLHRHNIHEHVSLTLAAVLSVLGVAALLAESYSNFVMTNGAKGFDNFATLIITCPALFLLFMKINIPGQSKNIALYSSAVYFVHLLFLNILRDHTHLIGTELILATIPCALAASYILVRLNQRNVWGMKYIL